MKRIICIAAFVAALAFGAFTTNVHAANETTITGIITGQVDPGAGLFNGALSAVGSDTNGGTLVTGAGGVQSGNALSNVNNTIMVDGINVAAAGNDVDGQFGISHSGIDYAVIYNLQNKDIILNAGGGNDGVSAGIVFGNTGTQVNSIINGGNITVTHGTAAAAAYGLAFTGNAAIAANPAAVYGSYDLGNITVTNNTADANATATGIFGAALKANASITAGDISATSDTLSTATGVSLTGVEANSALSVGKVAASGGTAATGMTLGAVAGSVTASDTVSATSANGTATAFLATTVDGPVSLQGITSSATGDAAIGIQTGAVGSNAATTFTVEGDVTVTGDRAVTGATHGTVGSANNATSLTYQGKISAVSSSTGGIATGFNAGALTNATIDLQDTVTATSFGANAAQGVVLGTLDGASVTLNGITAATDGTSNANATGLDFDAAQNNASTMTLNGDITATGSGTGTAVGINATGGISNFLNRTDATNADTSEGLVIDKTITASVAGNAGTAYAVRADGDATGGNLVTIKKDGVLVADANTALSIDFNAQAAVGEKNEIVFDVTKDWNNDGNAFTTANSTDWTVKSGHVFLNDTNALVANGGGDDRVVTIDAGSSLTLDGIDYVTNLDVNGNPTQGKTVDLTADVFDVYGHIDGRRFVDPTAAAAGPAVTFVGDVNLRAGGGATFDAGWLPADAAAPQGAIYNTGAVIDGVIAVEAGSQIEMNVDPRTQGDGFILVGLSGGDFWTDAIGNGQDATNANAAMGFNPFYYLEAFNTTDVDATAIAAIGIRQRSMAYLPELYVMSNLVHSNRTILDATTDRMNQNSMCIPCKPQCGRDFWVNYVGRKNDKLRSTSMGMDMEFESNGVQLGLDFLKTRCGSLGVMFGYEDSELQANDGFGSKLEAEDVYFGLYGQRQLRCGWDMRGVLGYGRQSFDLYRNARYDGGMVRRSADFDGNTFEGTLEFGKRMYANKCLSFRPVFGFDIYNSDVDDATEGFNGGDARNVRTMHYGGTSLTQLFARVGTDMQLNRNRVNLHVGAFYSHQLLSDGDTTSAFVTDMNQGGVSLPMYYEMGDSILSINAGASYMLGQSRRLALYGGYNGDFYLDAAKSMALHTGTIGLRWTF